MSHKFAVLANTLSMFAQKLVRERLALQLAVLRGKNKVNFKPGLPVEGNVSRDELASLAGTSRENVVRVVTECKDSGIFGTKKQKNYY